MKAKKPFVTVNGKDYDLGRFSPNEFAFLDCRQGGPKVRVDLSNSWTIGSRDWAKYEGSSSNMDQATREGLVAAVKAHFAGRDTRLAADRAKMEAMMPARDPIAEQDTRGWIAEQAGRHTN
jgi:hypothetical protein